MLVGFSMIMIFITVVRPWWLRLASEFDVNNNWFLSENFSSYFHVWCYDAACRSRLKLQWLGSEDKGHLLVSGGERRNAVICDGERWKERERFGAVYVRRSENYIPMERRERRRQTTWGRRRRVSSTSI